MLEDRPHSRPLYAGRRLQTASVNLEHSIPVSNSETGDANRGRHS